jgi:hypothetical protein
MSGVDGLAQPAFGAPFAVHQHDLARAQAVDQVQEVATV